MGFSPEGCPLKMTAGPEGHALPLGPILHNENQTTQTESHASTKSTNSNTSTKMLQNNVTRQNVTNILTKVTKQNIEKV